MEPEQCWKIVVCLPYMAMMHQNPSGLATVPIQLFIVTMETAAKAICVHHTNIIEAAYDAISNNMQTTAATHGQGEEITLRRVNDWLRSCNVCSIFNTSFAATCIRININYCVIHYQYSKQYFFIMTHLTQVKCLGYTEELLNKVKYNLTFSNYLENSVEKCCSFIQ